MPSQENECTGNNFPSTLQCKETLRISCNEKSQFQKMLCAVYRVQEGCGIANPVVSHSKEALEIKENFDAQLQDKGKRIKPGLQKQQHSHCFKPWVQALLPLSEQHGWGARNVTHYCTAFQTQLDNCTTQIANQTHRSGHTGHVLLLIASLYY